MNSILSILVSFLLAFSLLQIGLSRIDDLRSLNPIKEISKDPDMPKELEPRQFPLPDIYYLVFDRYANENTLKEYYNYDNSDFLNNLKEKGFFIAHHSNCNHPGTYLSLSSSLNMRYNNDLLKDGPIKKKVVYLLLQDFRVWRLLKSVGYKYIHFGSWYEQTKSNKYADLNFKAGYLTSLSHDFMLRFLETTIFAHLTTGNVTFFQHRERVLNKFDGLAKIPEMDGPKFIFAHMLIPHSPFVFGPNGEKLTREEVLSRNLRENYINQLIFANKKIKNLVDELLSKSKTPPIIILQSDEGPGEKEFSAGKYNKKAGNAMRIRARCRILNAYYLPGVNKDVLYDSISPVNTFRLIFNLYFGTRLELLKDRTYITESNKIYIKRFRLVRARYFRDNAGVQ
jgi:hypothetical protein